jgi:cation diffusion facilitator family transporter
MTHAVSRSGSHRAVQMGLAVSVLEMLALVLAATVTGSSALTTQTATSVADVAGGVFLLIGVVSSGRAPDERHPLGYGRERFFWAFLAAVGIFVGGFGVALAETFEAFADPGPVGSYTLGYGVVLTLIVLDVIALLGGLRPLVHRAEERATTVKRLLWQGTDPAVTTVVLTSAAGAAGGVFAFAGLAGRELTGSPTVDAAASALIGLVLLATSVVLLHTNRELLTGRGLPAVQVAQMRRSVSAQPGIVAVPDLFAVVVGPGTVIVDADLVFDDDLDVPQVEAIIVEAAQALRRSWPSVDYVYLNPVSAHRSRRLTGVPMPVVDAQIG